MSVTIAAMEDIATSLPDVGFSTEGDIGNIIEVTDLGDDLGMNLLSNPKYTSSAPKSSISLNGGGESSYGKSMNVSGLAGIEEINLQIF